MTKAMGKIRSPNIRSVSKRAGVSPATVSRVLNNSPIPTHQTRERVLAAVKALGYQPSVSRKQPSNFTAHGSIRQPVNGVVGYLSTREVFDRYHTDEGYATQAAFGLHTRLTRSGYQVLWSALSPEPPGLPAAILTGQVDGIFIEGHLSQSLLRSLPKRLPIVFISHAHPEVVASTVGVHLGQAVHSQLEYLWSLGHRRIALFQPEARNRALLMAAQAYETFFQEKGMAPPCAALSAPRAISPATHERVMDEFSRDLAATDPRPTALLAADNYARSQLFFLPRAGLSIPTQISVAGFNDLESGADTCPPLTSYRFPKKEVGRIAAELLLEHIQQPNQPHRQILVHGQRVERASCGPCLE